MPTHKLNWIKKISTQKFKLCIKQYGTESVQKTAAEKRIFLSYLSLSKKSEKIQAYRGCKVAVTVKTSAHL